MILRPCLKPMSVYGQYRQLTDGQGMNMMYALLRHPTDK